MIIYIVILFGFSPKTQFHFVPAAGFQRALTAGTLIRESNINSDLNVVEKFILYFI